MFINLSFAQGKMHAYRYKTRKRFISRDKQLWNGLQWAPSQEWATTQQCGYCADWFGQRRLWMVSRYFPSFLSIIHPWNSGREHHSRVVSTRHYRAPEVILGLGWGESIDIWSLGCLLFEYYTGKTMFQTHDNIEHLAMMESTLGKLPSSMVRETKMNFYTRLGANYALNWDENTDDGVYVKTHCRPLNVSFDEYWTDLDWNIEILPQSDKSPTQPVLQFDPVNVDLQSDQASNTRSSSRSPVFCS